MLFRSTFGSLRGFMDTVRATFDTTYTDPVALEMLQESSAAVHAHNPLVQIGDAAELKETRHERSLA